MKLNLYPVPVPPGSSEPDYTNPIGTWRVTTEGDLDCRTTTHLGSHYGHLAEIAFSLADKCEYTLTFHKEGDVDPRMVRPMYTATRDRVNVKMNINSVPWTSPEDKERVRHYHRFLDTPDIIVLPSHYFASVTLELNL